MASWEIKRSDAEIDAVLNIAHDQEDQGGTAYSGMSFEMGVAQGIEWACGLGGDEPPLP
jgi:hypothetical protein